MRLPVPDPLAVLARGQGLIDQATSLLPRALALLGEAETLVRGANALIERIEETRAAADEVVQRTDRVVADANALIVRTAGTVGSVEPTLDRAQRLLDSFAPSLERLQPTLDRLARSTSPEEVEALVQLVDHLPMLVGTLETDLLPIISNMENVGADIHDLLDMATEVNAMMAKLPGMGRARQRVEDRQASRD
ncbi:hypothetical protein [Aeromicrobium sp. CF3.5]|uniref:hypothetical protein n=1 Tax=Aeromicrobium sp. CF3.5 TaxID=3373078 RepID=UPI003EE77333